MKISFAGLSQCGKCGSTSISIVGRQPQRQQATSGKAVKIAVGCAAALALVVVLAIAAVVGLVMLGKSKVEFVGQEAQRIEELRQEANAHPFTRPGDGIVKEGQLVRFLGVRKAVFAVYEKNRAQIDKLRGGKDASFGDIAALPSLVARFHAAQGEAQVEAAMSDAEYAFLLESVYRGAWAAEVRRSTGGKSTAQATEEALAEARRQLEQAAREGEGDDVPEEARHALEEGRKTFEDRADEARAAAARLDVPPENLALFHKYEADIQKYSMQGLEFLGL